MSYSSFSFVTFFKYSTTTGKGLRSNEPKSIKHILDNSRIHPEKKPAGDMLYYELQCRYKLPILQKYLQIKIVRSNHNYLHENACIIKKPKLTQIIIPKYKQNIRSLQGYIIVAPQQGDSMLICIFLVCRSMWILEQIVQKIFTCYCIFGSIYLQAIFQLIHVSILNMESDDGSKKTVRHPSLCYTRSPNMCCHDRSL